MVCNSKLLNLCDEIDCMHDHPHEIDEECTDGMCIHWLKNHKYDSARSNVCVNEKVFLRTQKLKRIEELKRA